MMINRPPQATGRLTPEGVLAEARRGEAAGFDVLSFADWAVGDPFPPLMLVAQATERAALMTRVVGSATRSPVLLASGAAWVDQASGGRFMLGLGASIPDVVSGRHGLAWGKPATRMEETLKLIRALWGEEIPGIDRNPDGSLRFPGKEVRTERAFVDILPARRPPLIVAASGPRMLRIAGAWADGIILELTTPEYVRWAVERVREGASAAGRSLDGFEVCVQSSITVESDDPSSLRQRQWALEFYINHCVYPEFKHLWPAAGLAEEAAAVKTAVEAGDRDRAGRLVRELILPRMVVWGARAETHAKLLDWIGARIDAGATMFSLPTDVEAVTGIDLATIRKEANRRQAARTPNS
jgi:alkanesulfonate monooxygenase SsuD/methylene tetrahydromethanopterin reductase-like flavin-dependent oxidoreductase (luciferase family)